METVQNKPALEVLYEDEYLAAVAKPEKLLTHRTEIANGDRFFALQLARERFGRHVWPVYRLDRGTSGVLLFAFSSEIVAALSRQDSRVFQKRYLAVVRGFAPEEMLIDHPLKPPVDPYLRVQKTEPQEAVTFIRTLGTAVVPIPQGAFDRTRLSLVSAELKTGRRHQIRRHMKFIAHPIIGDATYGKGPLNRALAAYFGFDRLLLHCEKVSFLHPISGERLTIESSLFGNFKTLIEQLGWGENLVNHSKKSFYYF